MDTNIIKFDYTKESLLKIKSELDHLLESDDKNSIQTGVKALVKTRGIIQKQGKQFRDEANAYNKRVLEIEKEYLGIIEPLELELKNKIVQIEKEEIRKIRLESLPSRRALIEPLTYISLVEDELILTFDDKEFLEFLSKKTQENDQVKKTQEEKKRIEKEIQENATKEAEEKLKREFERQEQQRTYQEQEKIRKEAEEKRRLENENRYQDFLKSHNYEPNNFYTLDKGDVVLLYKQIGIYKK